MDESADHDDLDWESEPSEHEIGDGGADEELSDGSDSETPFFHDGFEVGAREHKADTDD